MRRLILAILIAAPALIPGVAMAAPGDPPPGNPPLTLPAQPDSLYPLFSRCYDLAPAGNLPRRACYSFISATGEIVRDANGDPDGQTFTYAPPNTLTAPEIAPYTPPAPYVPPAGNVEANDDDPLGPYPTPAPVRPVEREPIVEQAVRDTTPGEGDPMSVGTGPETCVPNASRGMPGFDPILDDDNDGVSCEQASNLPMADEANEAEPLDPTLVTVATVAALVLLLAVTLPLAQKRRARHAAE